MCYSRQRDCCENFGVVFAEKNRFGNSTEGEIAAIIVVTMVASNTFDRRAATAVNKISGPASQL